ncbi:MAG: hypothetical protein IKB86_03720 [Clostridia bacterium]|nr:hypothetical protein [Clostridia bacterium]
MKKRILSLILAFILCFTVASVGVYGEEAENNLSRQAEEETEEKQIPYIGIALMVISFSAAAILAIRKIKGITDAEEEKTDSK